ncbi:MAG: ATP-binding protein [Phycisphaerae bacterium]
MSELVCLLIGILLGAVVGSAATLLTARRIWRSVRRMSARRKGDEHFRELGHLVGGLAHEIKNPLSTMNVNLQLLREDLARSGPPDRQRCLRRLDSLRGESERLREILDDFMRFAGRYELDLEKVDLRNVIEELTDFFSAQADAAHVVLRTSLPEAPVSCKVDVGLLKQAVLNLMINAVQAMSEGGELLVRLSSNRGKCCVEVIDTGPGMDDETKARIFDAYYSTRKGGTGLGLPTTRRIVREHDGGIRVDSEPGKGTRFIIELPLADN